MSNKKISLTEAARIARGDYIAPPTVPIQFDGEAMTPKPEEAASSEELQRQTESHKITLAREAATTARYDAKLDALESELQRLTAVISTPEVYAGVVTEECEKYWAVLLKSKESELQRVRDELARQAALSEVKYGRAVARIEGLEAELRRREGEAWIPVSQELPQEKGQYLCYYATRGFPVHVTEFDPSLPHTVKRLKTASTHWMPIPPKPDNQKEPL